MFLSKFIFLFLCKLIIIYLIFSKGSLKEMYYTHVLENKLCIAARISECVF